MDNYYEVIIIEDKDKYIKKIEELEQLKELLLEYKDKSIEVELHERKVK